MKFNFKRGYVYHCNSDPGSCPEVKVDEEGNFLFYDTERPGSQICFNEENFLEFLDQVHVNPSPGIETKSFRDETSVRIEAKIDSVRVSFIDLNGHSSEVFFSCSSWNKLAGTIKNKDFGIRAA